MKRILFPILILLYSGTTAQEIRKKISSIQNVEEAQDFIQKHPALSGEIYSMYPSRDTGTIEHMMVQEKKGKILEHEGFYYKILQDTQKTFSKVSYIYMAFSITFYHYHLHSCKYCRSRIGTMRGDRYQYNIPVCSFMILVICPYGQ